MRDARTSAWVGGTVVVALLIVAGMWLLLISPRLDSAAANASDAEFEQERVEQLQIQLTALKRDYANIEVFRAELAELEMQIPTTTRLTDLTRDLDTIASTSGVVVTSVQPSTPTTVAVEAPAPAPVDPAADEAGSDDAGTDDAAVPPAPTTTESDYYVMQLTIVTEGGWAESREFVRRLQEENVRLVVVSGVAARALEEEGSTGGRPAAAPGDVELTLTAYVGILPDASAGPPEAEDGEGEAPATPVLPVPTVPDSPFAPLG